jgi:hypothetical protein
MKRFFNQVLSAVIFSTLILASSVATADPPPLPFFNGFEIDTAGWFEGLNPDVPLSTRVASGTDGIASAAGEWHAKVHLACQGGSGQPPACAGNPFMYTFTRWGGYSSVFPSGGYTTSVDIYLDVDGGWANDTRFDFTSAINTPAGGHRRDFVFNAGFYSDATGPGAGTNRFVVSASNSAFRANSFPKNSGRSPIFISATGWYTFEHRFVDNGSGILAVQLTIRDTSAAVVGSWTLSDPSDVIGTTVGGNRYGWFAMNEFDILAFDNTFRSGLPAQGLKMTALSKLQAIVPDSNKDANRLEMAVDALEKSLAPEFWEDAAHLTVKGDKVFTLEKKAVTELQKIEEEIPAVAEAIALLIAADRQLAEVALDDAIAGDGDPQHIETAQRELEKAAKELAKGHLGPAIDHYRNAWKHAEKALAIVLEEL